MKAQRITFFSGENLLEGLLVYNENKLPNKGIIVCHPHPQYGGSMENNVVQAVIDTFASKNYVCLAFNFRGVGRSQGSYGGGEGEKEDVKAAIDFLSSTNKTDRGYYGLVGYSFGAWVGMKAAAEDPRIKCTGLISPPVGMLSFDFSRGYKGPVIVVSGDSDPFCIQEDVRGFIGGLSGPKEWKTISGVDHFYFNKEREATGFLCEMFMQLYPPR